MPVVLERLPGVAGGPEPVAGDWLADAVAAAGLSGQWLGPLKRPVLGRLSWADTVVVARVPPCTAG